MKSLSGFLFAVLAFASTAFAAMNGPTGLAVDASGNLYVSNFNANTVQVYNPAHKLIRTISNGVNQPYGLAVDGMGFLHVANYSGGTVTRYDSTGKLVGTLLGLVNPIFLTGRWTLGSLGRRSHHQHAVGLGLLREPTLLHHGLGQPVPLLWNRRTCGHPGHVDRQPRRQCVHPVYRRSAALRL